MERRCRRRHAGCARLNAGTTPHKVQEINSRRAIFQALRVRVRVGVDVGVKIDWPDVRDY